MSTAAAYHERKLLSYWITMPESDRRILMEQSDGSYTAFMDRLADVVGRANDLELSMKRKGSDANAVGELMQRQMAVVLERRKPKVSKKKSFFLLRHLWSAREFLRQGRSYAEISTYLRLYRKFAIAPRTLKEWIEEADIKSDPEVTL